MTRIIFPPSTLPPHVLLLLEVNMILDEIFTELDPRTEFGLRLVEVPVRW